MELKPCKCGSTDINLRLVVWAKSSQSAYSYQCEKCGKAACAWAESEDVAVEIWNNTVK